MEDSPWELVHKAEVDGKVEKVPAEWLNSETGVRIKLAPDIDGNTTGSWLITGDSSTILPNHDKHKDGYNSTEEAVDAARQWMRDNPSSSSSMI